MQTVVGLVAAGAGVSLVPISIAEQHGKSGVAYRPLNDHTPSARIAVASRKSSPSHTVGAFLSTVDEVAARCGSFTDRAAVRGTDSARGFRVDE